MVNCQSSTGVPSANVPACSVLADPSLAEWPAGRVAEVALGIERRALEADPRVVGVEQAALADDGCSVLMGDDVESRKQFIQTNAKDVRFLDI